MRVLVVEDHPRLATTIATVLRREGMAADVAFDGQDALDHAAAAVYDVIVLDRNLPRVHGDDVCRSLVDGGCQSRILMLTASGAVEDRVDGLGLGADSSRPSPTPTTRTCPQHPNPAAGSTSRSASPRQAVAQDRQRH